MAQRLVIGQDADALMAWQANHIDNRGHAEFRVSMNRPLCIRGDVVAVRARLVGRRETLE